MGFPDFHRSPEEDVLLDKIMNRVTKIMKDAKNWSFDEVSCKMDLIATHNHAQPLDLARLAEADDFNLMHDVCGISRHLDRTTGELRDFFSPRYSVSEAA